MVAISGSQTFPLGGLVSGPGCSVVPLAFQFIFFPEFPAEWIITLEVTDSGPAGNNTASVSQSFFVN